MIKSLELQILHDKVINNNYQLTKDEVLELFDTIKYLIKLNIVKNAEVRLLGISKINFA